MGHSMNPRVFLSYRREDSAAYAGRIEDRLRRALGRNQLFMDVDNIPLGVNFAKLLQDEIARCDVLLVVIGRNWLGARGDDERRRLDKPDDFVRIEIATALRRDIPVIPVLLDGAAVPKADELPEELKDLALSNAFDLRHASFHNDIKRLIRSLKAPHQAANITRICVGCGAGLLVAVLPGLLAFLLAAPEWWAHNFPLQEIIRPHYQRAFEFGAFIFSGAAAAVLRQRGGSRLTVVAVSTMLALFIFAVEQLVIPTSVLFNITPAFYGYQALPLFLLCNCGMLFPSPLRSICCI
jgi:TIR domain